MSLYGIGETFNHGFGTYNSSGALTNADSLPTGTLVVNGTDSGATVTVTSAATGRYKVAASLTGRSVGDDCFVRYSATVGGVTQESRSQTFRIAFGAALAGAMVTVGTSANQINLSGGIADANVKQVNGTNVTTSDGTAQAGTSTTITLASGDAAGTNAYVDRRITLTGGTGIGQSRVITAYNSSTKVATVHRAWDTTPDATSVYTIDPTSVANLLVGNTPQTGDVFARLGAPAGASTAADIAAIKGDTGTILTDVNTGAGAIYTRLGAPAGASLAADVAAIAAKTVNLPASPAAVGSTMTLGTIDGIAFTTAMRAMLAFNGGGKSTYTDNGDGTYTLIFKAQDTTTTVLSVTASKADGHRTATTIS